MNYTAFADSIGGIFMSKTKENSINVAMLGLFSGIIVVLQSLSYVIKIGTFNLSLVLIPVVLGAVIFGARFGAISGGVFGAVALIASIIGVDAGGSILFQSSPFFTIAVCLVKGIAAGFIAGLIGDSAAIKNRYVKTVLAAVAAPIINTGIFVAAMFLFFKETLFVWSGENNVFYYTIFTLIGINFIIEFSINAVFSPVIYRIINALRRNHIG